MRSERGRAPTSRPRAWVAAARAAPSHLGAELRTRSRTVGTSPVPVGRLIAPLRLDVLVRAQFLESLGDLDEASADTQAVAYAARRTDYYRWFLSVAAYRNRRLRGSHPVAVEAAFDLRVRRSIELARNFRDAGFDPAYPIVLRAGQTILPTSTGKVLGRQLFLSDGCHRLALLVLAGVTELGPSHYVVERHRQIVPTDNTAILLRRLVLDDASYYGFLARGYATEPAEDRVALVAATPAALQAELAQILAIDEALIAQNSRGADDLVAPKGGDEARTSGTVAWTLGRARRHAGWLRTEGLGRLIEEDDLDPVARARTALTKARWRRHHGVAPGAARAVFLVGLQRSGTNMLVHGLERAPEVEVRNENDRRTFERYQLRSDAVVAGVTAASRHELVLFKPLCDSHRIVHLLDDLALSSPVAIWAYREVDGRVRSAVAKFGDANLLALRAIAEGGGSGLWQAGGLSEQDVEELRSLEPQKMSALTAAACFWWLRNRLFLTLGLDRRSDVLLTSYEGFLNDPEAAMRRVCDHLGFAYRADLVAHVEKGRRPVASPLDIDPRVRRRCNELTELLAHVERSRPGRGA